jgi:hypothetical protein
VALALNFSQSFADDGGVMKKMEQIEAQQERMIQTLDEIKSELNIIKVRITSNQ